MPNLIEEVSSKFWGAAPLTQLDLDTPIVGLDGETHADNLICGRPNPEQALSRKYDPRAEVMEIFKKFTLREKQVVLLQSRGICNEEIGKRLGISRERVRQVGEDARRVAHDLPRRNRSTEGYENKGCGVCGKSLAGNRDGRIFCSDRCRHKNFRDRRKAANAADILCNLR